MIRFPIPLDAQVAAKGDRDTVRNAIVQVLKKTEGLSEELRGLLVADEMATQRFEKAVNDAEDNGSTGVPEHAGDSEAHAA